MITQLTGFVVTLTCHPLGGDAKQLLARLLEGNNTFYEAVDVRFCVGCRMYGQTGDASCLCLHGWMLVECSSSATPHEKEVL